MQTTTITQQGNSSSVILPTPLMREANWHRGQKVTLDYIAQTDGVLIRRVKKTRAVPSRSEKEFQSWLDRFLKEDAELLDELPHR